MRYGVPFDVAFSLDPVQRAAWSIIVSEQGGRTFDIDRMVFTEE